MVEFAVVESNMVMVMVSMVEQGILLPEGLWRQIAGSTWDSEQGWALAAHLPILRFTNCMVG